MNVWSDSSLLGAPECHSPVTSSFGGRPARAFRLSLGLRPRVGRLMAASRMALGLRPRVGRLMAALALILARGRPRRALAGEDDSSELEVEVEDAAATLFMTRNTRRPFITTVFIPFMPFITLMGGGMLRKNALVRYQPTCHCVR